MMKNKSIISYTLAGLAITCFVSGVAILTK